MSISALSTNDVCLSSQREAGRLLIRRPLRDAFQMLKFYRWQDRAAASVAAPIRTSGRACCDDQLCLISHVMDKKDGVRGLEGSP